MITEQKNALPLLDAALKAHQKLMSVVEWSRVEKKPLGEKELASLTQCASQLSDSIEHAKQVLSEVSGMKPVMSRQTARAVICKQAGNARIERYEPEIWLLDALIELSKIKHPNATSNLKTIRTRAESAGYSNFDPAPFVFRAIEEVQFMYREQI